MIRFPHLIPTIQVWYLVYKEAAHVTRWGTVWRYGVVSVLLVSWGYVLVNWGSFEHFAGHMANWTAVAMLSILVVCLAAVSIWLSSWISRGGAALRVGDVEHDRHFHHSLL